MGVWVATDIAAEIYVDLRMLSKGFGVHDPQVRRKVGRALAEICGISAATSQAEARARLRETLEPLCRALPSGDRVLTLPLAARVALAIEEGYEDQRLGERQQELAARRHCDIRTVRRRCDYAFQLISSHLAKQLRACYGSGQTGERYLDSLRVFLRLDRGPAVAREEGTVVSTVDCLTRVANGLGLPRHHDERAGPRRLDVEIEYGGRLVRVEQPTPGYFLYHVDLARPVPRGRSHTYSRIVRLPPDQKMAPHYVFRPLHPCNRFELRIKFDPGALPLAVWKVQSEPGYRANWPGRELIRPDQLGEVQVAFHDLNLGLGYGLVWLPAE